MMTEMSMSWFAPVTRLAPAIRLPGMLALALLAACASHGPATAAADTIVVVRHAEKADDGTRDPPLSATGQARAEAIARRLADAPLALVLATEYRRTRLTGMPAATTHGLEVEVAPGATPAAVVAERARAARGTALVIGHSNTVPGIVAALCDCEVAPLDESDYDRWYELRRVGDGYRLLESRY
jgi:phosphohistidine phosphatase SixA